MALDITDNPLSNFGRGFSYPFHAGRFIRRHPRLLQYILVPFSINVGAFCLVVYFGLRFFNDIVIRYLPQGEAWYWAFLYYTLWMFAALVTMVLVFFSFTVIGNLIASPFNELLSARAEELLTGRPLTEAFSFGAFVKDTARILAYESKKISVFVLGMLFLLLLNLFPGGSALLYSPLSVLWTMFFLVVEYTGYVFSRRRLPFAAQRHFIFSRKALALGFGAGILCLLAIPLLQFFCIPLGVVGAVQLCNDSNLDGKETFAPPADIR